MATEGQQHPIKIYFWIWALLFVFSFFSYMVDWWQLEGMTRWTMIIIFMLLKAGFIVAIFMHMKWERYALVFAILVPPAALIVFMFLMSVEAEYAWATRVEYMGENPAPIPELPPTHRDLGAEH